MKDDPEVQSPAAGDSLDERQLRNPYLYVLAASQPDGLVDFEFETDPYRNSLPGVSNVQAARTVGRGLREGTRGHFIMLCVSLLLVAVLVLPSLAAVIAQAFH
jgi:hypothetical protein